jgi:putative transposase
MTRNINFVPDEYYHIYNRGTEKRNIFSSKSDYNRFLSLLYISNNSKPVHLQFQGRTLNEVTKIERGKKLVDICVYCLMPNHFHLLIREKEDGGISRFMQKLITGYTMYFNKRHERTGALFQGKFQATHADEDTYLKYLVSYIHLNPVKLIEPKWKENGIANRKKSEKYLEGYPYSSYLDYIGQNRIEKNIIQTDSLPEYFETPKDFKTHVREWLSSSRFDLDDRKGN